MEIRTILDTDIAQLLAVEEMAQSIPWSEAAFQRCIEANYPGWVVITDTGHIIAFILISLAIGECHILNVGVHPGYQRQGWGERLMLYAMGWAKNQGAGIVYLEVRRSNRHAIALYRKLNFKLLGERRDYYPAQHGKEDALIFARDIGEYDC